MREEFARRGDTTSTSNSLSDFKRAPVRRLVKFCILSAAIGFGIASSAFAQLTPSNFQAPTAYNGDPNFVPLGLATGDFNNDGLLDFVVAETNVNTSAGRIVFYLGNADGSFTESGALPVNGVMAGQSLTNNHIISVGHFNGASQPLGVAVAVTSSPTCPGSSGGVLVTYSMPSSTSAGITVCLPNATPVTSVAVADFNTDGFDDIAVSNSSGAAAGTFTVYLNVANSTSGESGFFNYASYSAQAVNTSPGFQILYGTIVAGDIGLGTPNGIALLASTGPFTQYVDVFVPGNVTVKTVTTLTFNQPVDAGVAPPNGFSDIALSNPNGPGSASIVAIGSQGLEFFPITAFTKTSANPVLGSPTQSPRNSGFAVASANLNQNTNEDVVYLNESHDASIVLDPVFANPTQIPAFGPVGQALAAGSSTGLKKTVVVTAGIFRQTSPTFTEITEARSINVYLVDPTTGFPSIAPIFAPTTNSQGILPAFAVGDFDGDGLPDVAVLGLDQSNFAATVAPFLNRSKSGGPAAFAPQSVIDLGSGNTTSIGNLNAYSLAAGSFHVVLPDIALVTAGGITLLENQGPTGSPDSVSFALDPNCQGISALASPVTNCYLANDSHFPGIPFNGYQRPPIIVADLNNDGFPDIVVAFPENCNATDSAKTRAAIYVLLSNGDGSFKPPIYIPSPVVDPVGLAFGKILGSSSNDVVVVNGGEQCSSATTGISDLIGAALLPNNHDGSGTFGAPATIFASAAVIAPPFVSSVAIGDLNGDGVPDIAISANDGIHVLLNSKTSPGSLTDQGAAPLYAPADAITNAAQIDIADLNGDGLPDVGAVVDGIVYVFAGNGAGQIGSPAQGFSSGPDSFAIKAIDVDGNGAPDVLVSDSQGFAALLSNATPASGVGAAAHLVLDGNIANVGPLSTFTNIIYGITIQNGGPATATHVKVVYNVGANLQFVPAASSSQCALASSAQVVCSIASLGPGANSGILQIVVIATAPGSYAPAFSVSGDQPEGIPASDATATFGFSVGGSSCAPLVAGPTVLPAATVGSFYDQPFTVSGGTSPYVWSFEGSSNLAGLTFTGGASASVTGTPLASGSGSFTWGITDSKGCTGSLIDQLTVFSKLSIGESGAVPAGTVGIAFPQITFTATGGVAPYSYSWAFLPPGLSVNSVNGVLSGTPTTAGTYSSAFIIATDSRGATSSLPLTILIYPSANLAIIDTINVHDSVTTTGLINIAGPVAFFSAGSLGFGSVAPGNTATQTISLTNIGEQLFSLTSVMATAPFSVTAISCSTGATSTSTTIPAGGICTFTISYLAPATPSSGSLTFTDSAGLSNMPIAGASPTYTQSIPLSGSGAGSAAPPAPLATVTLATITDPISVTDMPVFTQPAPVILISPLFHSLTATIPSGGTAVTYTAAVTVADQGNVGVTNLSATAASITAVVNGKTVVTSTNTSVPVVVSNLAAGGAAGNITVNFPGAAGPAGATALLRVTGTYTTVAPGGATLSGTWGLSQKVSLPAPTAAP